MLPRRQLVLPLQREKLIKPQSTMMLGPARIRLQRMGKVAMERASVDTTDSQPWGRRIDIAVAFPTRCLPSPLQFTSTEQGTDECMRSRHVLVVICGFQSSNLLPYMIPLIKQIPTYFHELLIQKQNGNQGEVLPKCS